MDVRLPQHLSTNKSICGTRISDDQTRANTLPSIPRYLYERWRRIIVPKLERDWNQNHDQLMAKMVAGYLLDPISLRSLLKAESMPMFKRLADVTDIFIKRVEAENRALNHEELATLEKLTRAIVAFTEAANNICNVDSSQPKKKSKGDDGEDTPENAPPETPRFYKVNNLEPGFQDKPAV